MFGLGRHKRATKYPHCPKCRRKDWIAKSRAEMSGTIQGQYVRQGFDCPNCRVRVTLGRGLHEDKWVFVTPMY